MEQALSVAPVTGSSLCMSDRHDVKPVVVVAVNDLKWKLAYAAGAMFVINFRKPLGVRFDIREREVNGNTELPSSGLAALSVPIYGRL